MIRITGKEWLYLAVALIGGILGGTLSSRFHASAASATEAPTKRIRKSFWLTPLVANAPCFTSMTTLSPYSK
jgi:hypothetical protein